MAAYNVSDDIQLACDVLGMPMRELAERLGVSEVALDRWKSGAEEPSSPDLEALYAYAFKRGLRLNQIKSQLYEERLGSQGCIAVFHGAKTSIEGPLTVAKSRVNNDFGQGFYCGENFSQSAMFVSSFPTSSVYVFGFDPRGLKVRRFAVDQDWMLAIAWFRGRLGAYADHERIARIRESVADADYVVAPIADNRMFEIIDSFIDGEITDVQCQHCLSATQLGNQYVFLNEAALGHLNLCERCYLSVGEKKAYLAVRQDDSKVGSDKVKVAKRQFRGQGRYIDEVLA